MESLRGQIEIDLEVLPRLDLHGGCRISVLGGGIKNTRVTASGWSAFSQGGHLRPRLHARSRRKRCRPGTGACEDVVTPGLQVRATKFTLIVGLRATDDVPRLSSVLNLRSDKLQRQAFNRLSAIAKHVTGNHRFRNKLQHRRKQADRVWPGWLAPGNSPVFVSRW